MNANRTCSKGFDRHTCRDPSGSCRRAAARRLAMGRRAARAGFTLLEVMLATGLLLGSVIVLAELASIGREHGNAVEDFATAQRLCQNRLNEMLCGISAIDEVDQEELPEGDGWTCSVTLEPLAQGGLVALRVTVAREAAPSRRARQFSLVRWIPDPSASDRGESFLAPGAVSPGARAQGGVP